MELTPNNIGQWADQLAALDAVTRELREATEAARELCAQVDRDRAARRAQLQLLIGGAA